MRNILRTVAGVVIFLTGYFYIFGKSNEGCAAEAKSPPIRQELAWWRRAAWCPRKSSAFIGRNTAMSERGV